MNDHQPEPWFWEAGSDTCPHGPEPEDDSPEWDDWHDRHTGSAQDVRICLDAPAGDACAACSEDDNEMVPWSACRARKRVGSEGKSAAGPIAHAPATVNVGALDCFELECEDFFDEDGEEIPGKTTCSHLVEMEICEGCTGPYKAGEFPAVVAWADCAQRLVKAGAQR
ncbi:hypothetical protein ABZ341_18115 [Streptomyces sp. NPDC006173]|uniref:hypothetical protein n=1 Tax=Streptomyces sp. NPDC006173 TaxID=3155349 RepID=UPI0033F70256